MFPFTISGTIKSQSYNINDSVGAVVNGLKKYTTHCDLLDESSLVFRSSIKWSLNPLNGVTKGKFSFFQENTQFVNVKYNISLFGSLVRGLIFAAYAYTVD